MLAQLMHSSLDLCAGAGSHGPPSSLQEVVVASLRELWSSYMPLASAVHCSEIIAVGTSSHRPAKAYGQALAVPHPAWVEPSGSCCHAQHCAVGGSISGERHASDHTQGTQPAGTQKYAPGPESACLIDWQRLKELRSGASLLLLQLPCALSFSAASSSGRIPAPSPSPDHAPAASAGLCLASASLWTAISSSLVHLECSSAHHSCRFPPPRPPDPLQEASTFSDAPAGSTLVCTAAGKEAPAAAAHAAALQGIQGVGTTLLGAVAHAAAAQVLVWMRDAHACVRRRSHTASVVLMTEGGEALLPPIGAFQVRADRRIADRTCAGGSTADPALWIKDFGNRGASTRKQPPAQAE
jgi:hypothetical protein